jgi:protein O-GlcNAc transferase
MSNREETQHLQLAFSLHRSGRFSEAAKLYRKIIKRNPRNIHALHSLGVIEAASGNLTEAAHLMFRSLSIQPTNIQFVENYATVLYQLGNHTAALDSSLKGCSIDNKNKSLLYVSAMSLLKLHRLQESLFQFDEVLLLEPNNIAVINERSHVLLEMKQYDAALAGIEKAISLDPKIAETHLNKGTLCGQLERHDEAIAAFQKALTLKPELTNAWHGYGKSLFSLHRYDEALIAYGKALSLDSHLEEVWLGRGNVLSELNRFEEALESYDKALALKPEWAEALLGRGNVFRGLKDYKSAFSAYDKALELKPDLENAWLGRGNVLTQFKRYDEAFAAYDKALALKPGLLGIEGTRLHSKMHLCNWESFESDCNHLIGSVRNNKQNTDPFVFLGISSSVEDQYNCARLWVSRQHPPANQPFWKGEIYKHNKIRIGYVSADFREHATSHLMAGLFENHNKSEFNITAISTGPNDNSPMRRRLEDSFENFVDARVLSDPEVAKQIRTAEIDILVDLKGFTQGARTNIFARRPAPIQVNYLGYPGTMGASYIDYIIGDPILIPASQQNSYTEKLVYLPNSYQANDTKRNVSEKMFTREECGLPNGNLVFCCFNSNYKIVPAVFDCWMRILIKVPGSVLWLLEDNATAAINLKREAELRGVSAERLVFAKRMPLPDHLARHRLADLFLDTLPYNAHTTASDALWAGLPVLTQLGETFAGRVAASLLNAIGLPELITKTPEEYERMAIDLAMHTERLATIKHKLAENRLTTPLFDTKRFTQHIEAAYIAMYTGYQTGMAPNHIVVPN